MLGRGYRDYPPSSATRSGRAGAMLWKQNTGLLEALQDIQTAAIECQVTLECALVVPSAPEALDQPAYGGGRPSIPRRSPLAR